MCEASISSHLGPSGARVDEIRISEGFVIDGAVGDPPERRREKVGEGQRRWEKVWWKVRRRREKVWWKVRRR